MTIDEMILEYTVCNSSVETIGRKIGMSSEAVRNLLAAHGVKLRSAREYTPERLEKSILHGRATPPPADGVTDEERLERYVSAVYSACPWGFNLKAAKAHLASCSQGCG